MTREQLLDRGYGRHAIEHRLATGRLFVVFRGVYAVGSPDLSQRGRWMAAVLACGHDGALSHDSGLELWGIEEARGGRIHVSGPPNRSGSHDGIVFHRRTSLDTTTRHGIRVTTPIQTLFDVAVGATERQLDTWINEAAKLNLITARQLHRRATAAGRQPGAAAIRRRLDRQTLLLTDSELERRFLRIIRRLGLPDPLTQARVKGFRVDFCWPDLRLIVETDGARFHQTPAQQTRDRRRDQLLTAAGFVVIRFTHAQVAYDAQHVASVLANWRR